MALLLQAESEENTCRKDLTPTEAEASYRERQELFKPAAEKAKEEGRKKGGKTAGKGRPKATDSSPRNSRKAKTGKRTRENKHRAAQGTGYSADTLEKVRQIREAAEADPETFGKLLEEMDTSGKSPGNAM